jgi:His/Glu/Gln/Arg/opine family amino acid ABC transporter permease subunit
MRRRWLDLDRLTSIAIAIVIAAVGIPYVWHWWSHRGPWVDPIAHYMLHTGLTETLRLAAISVIGATLIGITLGTLLTIRFLPSRALIRLYIEVWRGLPILVTLFLIYFAFPKAVTLPGGRQLSPSTAAIITLILWGSAQVAEATRGAIQSIPREQHEASAALGFGWVGRHAFVILPQAIRRLLPPLVSLLVNIIQNTTVASLIGVAEVLETGNRSVERLTFSTGQPHAFPIFLGVMALFFVISFPLIRLAAFLERRLV